MKKIDLTLYSSAIKHIRGEEDQLGPSLKGLEVMKGELFAFQILIKSPEQIFANLGQAREIPWTGLGQRLRIQLGAYADLFDLSFLGYVEEDAGRLVADPILPKKSLELDQAYQMVWVEGKLPEDFKEEKLNLPVQLFYSQGYEDEFLLEGLELEIDVLDHVVQPLQEGGFYLDLWQHFTNWGRAYDAEFGSDLHFEIVENYIRELAQLGNRVISLIVTDYPWAGQRCYEVVDNPSNLYEYNMVQVFKDKEGKLFCDFSYLDRYLDLCFNHGMDEEINLFGLLGNWDAYAFGNPIEGYKDPLRIQYFDQASQTYAYVKSKEELAAYLELLFAHLVERGLWDKVKILSDEPNNVDVFRECVAFINACIPGQEVHYKCPLHHQEFFENYGENIQGLSLNTCELVNNIGSLDQIQAQVHAKGGRFTWFSCCFPEDLNIFLKSPLLETRLKGWFSYYWKMDGFLRWAYAIWPRDPFANAKYKYPKWNAGDMFFVYPGKDLKPMPSVRLKNLIFGIQDFNTFKEIERKGLSAEKIHEQMAVLLGERDQVKFVPERNVEMNYQLDAEAYLELRNRLIKDYLLKEER